MKRRFLRLSRLDALDNSVRKKLDASPPAQTDQTARQAYTVTLESVDGKLNREQSPSSPVDIDESDGIATSSSPSPQRRNRYDLGCVRQASLLSTICTMEGQI